MIPQKAKKHPIKQRLVKFTNKNAQNRYIFASILSKKAKKITLKCNDWLF